MISVHAPASHYESPIVRGGLRVFALLLIVSGLASIVPVARSVIDARASRSWPTATGTIVRSAVEESPDPTRRSYRAKVEYSYAAAGRGWSSDQISFAGLGSTDRGSAEQIVAQYPAGSSVTVYYKPSDPQTSVLEPGAPLATYLWALISPVMVVLGVVVWRAQRRKPPSVAADEVAADEVVPAEKSPRGPRP